MDGRVEVSVEDAGGGAVPALVELGSRSPAFAAEAIADSAGLAVLRRIPEGLYRLTVTHDGFEPFERDVEVRSAVPVSVEVELAVLAVTSAITVQGTTPLFEPDRPSQPVRVGRGFLRRSLGTTPGRSTVDVITTMPGWLLEANAVLHPRGAEYDTQYVIDGMPLYDNRSLAFAPPFENDEFESVTVFTAGIPAEYGRRLGGVIALDSRRTGAVGHRSTAQLSGGSYGTALGGLTHQYATSRNVLSVGLRSGATDRYLDPPSLENFTNRGTTGGGNLRFARDLTGRDRVSAYGRFNRTRFLVPNDLEQQEAGQRQDRALAENTVQVHYQRSISSRSLFSMRGMQRSLTSGLWSNPLATPVYVEHGRNLDGTAMMADLTIDGEKHTFKMGGDVRSNAVQERFALAEPDELPELDLDFRDRKRSTEASVYVQDQIRFGAFAASLGVRFDHYEFLVTDILLSPRLAVSYHVPVVGVQIYAAYDRIFQPPPIENLLLSSAAAGLGLEEIEGNIAVPTSRANFFEVGVRKPFADKFRLEAKHYWRSIAHAIDDDVFLNTGLSFPITFALARVEGTEVRLEAPRWGRVSAVASYSHMLGRTWSPVTGGLFVEGGEAEELRDGVTEFPITQDQRNTVAAVFQVDLSRRAWFSVGIRYGSGLPIEIEDDDDDEDDDDGPGGDVDDDDEGMPVGAGIPTEILQRVNLERGRVRPRYSLDFSFGARIWERGHRSLTLQADVRNVTDRLNVINFSGLFSGTALAPGRLASLQLRVQF